MTRSMSPEREKELGDLLGFVDLYIAIEVPETLPRELHPRFVAERIALERGTARALEGTRQAVNDIIEQLSHLKPEDVSAFDSALGADGLPTLSELRRRYSSAYRRVLRRNQIRTETEYYLVKNLVDDLTSSISSGERDMLIAMMEAYEG